MKKVLVVDPNPTNFSIYQGIIKQRVNKRCEIFHANSQETALLELGNNKFDLVISELFPLRRNSYSQWLKDLILHSQKAKVIIASANFYAHSDTFLNENYTFFEIPLNYPELTYEIKSLLETSEAA